MEGDRHWAREDCRMVRGRARRREAQRPGPGPPPPSSGEAEDTHRGRTAQVTSARVPQPGQSLRRLELEGRDWTGRTGANPVAHLPQA